MSKRSSKRSDDYSRLGYRRFVAWPARIQREGPFLIDTLSRVSRKRVLDLGCASGEHSRFLASQGFSVVGVDVSEESLDLARGVESSGNVRFVQGDIRDLKELVSPGFGGAICLGNTLVHLLGESDLRQAFDALAAVLDEGGIFLFQILNYARLRRNRIRHLPLNFMQEEEDQRIFLRLMEFLPNGRVRFCPTTLRFRPTNESPVEVLESRSIELRGWERDEVVDLLTRSGLHVTDVFGDMTGRPFAASDSTDLVVVAERRRK